MVCPKDYVVITTNRLGNIVSWNNDAKAIFGHSIDKVMGKSIMSIIPEHDNVYAPLPWRVTNDREYSRFFVKTDASNSWKVGIVGPKAIRDRLRSSFKV